MLAASAAIAALAACQPDRGGSASRPEAPPPIAAPEAADDDSVAAGPVPGAEDWRSDLGWTAPPGTVYASWCPAPPATPRGGAPTPVADFEGSGTRWTALLGRSDRDFPGPGAVVAAEAAQGGLTTLLAVASPPGCGAAASALPGGVLGHIVDLAMEPAPSESGGYRCVGADGRSGPCFPETQRLVEAGALVVAVRPSAGVLEARPAWLREYLARLACHVRVFSSQRGTTAHLALRLPAGSGPLLWQLADVGDLLFLEGVGSLSDGELRLLALARRALGHRVVLDSSLLSPGPGTAEHLLSGGAVERSTPSLPAPLHRAIDFVRANPELASRPATSTGLLLEPGYTDAGDAVAVADLLRDRRVPFDVVLAGPVAPAGGVSLSERLSRFTGLVVPGGVPMLDETRSALDGWHGRVLAASGIDALAVDTFVDGLPATVVVAPSSLRVERFLAPERNMLVHHLLASGTVPGATLDVPRWRRGEFRGCRARFWEPFAGGSSELACTMEPGNDSIHVQVPGFAHWGVMATELLAAQPVPGAGDAVVVQPPGATDRWAELTLRPPGWPAGEIVSLAFPEFFFAGGIEAQPWEGLIPAFSSEADGSVTLAADNGQVRASGRLRGTPDGVDVALAIRNLRDTPIRQVSALLCLSSRPSAPFPESGHGRTFFHDGTGLAPLDRLPADAGDPLYVETTRFAHPVTILEAAEGGWVLAVAAEGSSVAGGNGGSGGVCVHARPEFGDIAPGQEVRRRGRLWIGRGDAESVLADYLADPLEAAPRELPPPQAPPWAGSCRP